MGVGKNLSLTIVVSEQESNVAVDQLFYMKPVIYNVTTASETINPMPTAKPQRFFIYGEYFGPQYGHFPLFFYGPKYDPFRYNVSSLCQMIKNDHVFECNSTCGVGFDLIFYTVIGEQTSIKPFFSILGYLRPSIINIEIENNETQMNTTGGEVLTFFGKNHRKNTNNILIMT